VETHYQLGRALRDSERNFTGAVDQLNLANELDPENPRVLYHLGLAIRAMVERGNPCQSRGSPVIWPWVRR
jgi:hypothetical protein